MSQSPLSRCRAGTAALIAGLLLAAPLAAQEAVAPAAEAAIAPHAQPDVTPAPPAPAVAVTGAEAPIPPAAQPAAAPPATEVAPQEVAAQAAPTGPAPAQAAPAAPVDPVAPTVSERDPNLPHDLSPIGMFLAADWVVKGVMIGLALASVASWTVLVVKLLQLAGALRHVGAGTRRVETASGLGAALSATGARKDPVSRMIRAAAQEYDRSAPALDQAGDAGLKERVESHLTRIEAMAGRRMGRGTGVLATIGSTAPFVGLFGTVWGIMNSFIGISEAQTTNLAVVAPGIAEALLATAIGLVAAIPAVVIYNALARAITGYRLRLANAAAGVQRLVSRDLDFRGLPATAEG